MASIGELAAYQYTHELAQLEAELSGLALRKQSALTESASPQVLQRIEARVTRLSTSFAQSQWLVELLWPAGGSTDPDAERLRESVRRISRLIGEILRMDDPHWGLDSIADLVNEHRAKAVATGVILQPAKKGHDPVIELPGVPQSVASDPVLALAILFDVLRVWILGKSKKG